jgi:cell division protein ZapD
VTNLTVYELPLNERIRTLLRLEFLFQQAHNSLHGTSIWDSRATINHILDVLSIMGRMDLRCELIKELERQASALLAICDSPDIDATILKETLKKLEMYRDNLRATQSNVQVKLSNNELLKLIRQRNSVPGGTCDFDLPIYHFWLQQSAECRVEILQSWLTELDNYHLSITLILNLLRNSAMNTPIKAEQGFYQQALDISMPFQLIRVLLPSSSSFYAEMSGGKHRFSVRFMMPMSGERPAPCSEDIKFKLSCCAL